MVLLWRADTDGVSGPAPIKFDGSSNDDVSNFFFVYENSIMRGKSSEEKAGEVLCYLEGTASNFYHENFNRDCNLTEDVEDCHSVKKAINDGFVPIVRPEENISRARVAQLDPADLFSSLSGMVSLLENLVSTTMKNYDYFVMQLWSMLMSLS